MPDDVYSDGHNTSRAIELLRHLSQSDEPFFLAVGFHRPHLPFAVPNRYWALYDRSAIEVPSRQPAHRRRTLRAIGLGRAEELRGYPA